MVAGTVLTNWENITTLEKFYDYYGEVKAEQEYLVKKALTEAFIEIRSHLYLEDFNGDLINGLITPLDAEITKELTHILAAWIIDNGYLNRQGTTNASFQGKSVSQAIISDQTFYETFNNQLSQLKKYYKSYATN